ncbi:hypothetical protein TTHERM_00818350 (macronuclear) [Tetrahymena thermophila SB210]|uniref:Transmembrane protein n=1 Tax=Tetrahymena thermophila (strain SB210) TaxID=312017 RepID=Q23HB0_TETTS|nr:hypothetical protein TTHERM_00818350 [Tetrahymena thermophila SB210]EAR95898.1 hypothetical protein TTHERM_00818350 [Tetrahymena thermophila SB210]|eukprot:XP_001016143.1 hypothetical protein TTHERM_00818350 [Tetrahymena thermophila SB210]
MKLLAFLIVIVLVTVNADNSLSPMQCLGLLLKIKTGQICQEGDKDCTDALIPFNQCMENCDQQSTETTQYVYCVENNCKSTNPTIQRATNDFVFCANSAQDPSSHPNPSSSQSLIVLYSILLSLLFIII